MNAMAFDTLKTSKDLAAAGFEQAQAEALANVIATSLTSGVATKEDFAKLDGKIDALGARLDGKIEALSNRVDGRLNLHQWMIGVTITLNLAILVKLFIATP
jgi:hypothetical protein